MGKNAKLIMNTSRFTNAIVRKPSKNMVDGITTAALGKPDYELACQQHNQYIEALISCGLEVHILEANENYPDSTFIEDIALLTPYCAIITNPGAPSRKGEAEDALNIIREFYNQIEYIKEPGTIEAGDIMMVGDHFYIGLSERTNQEGARQMKCILNKYQQKATNIILKDMLHLKTGVAYLENNILVATGEFVTNPIFKSFQMLEVEADESYAANCIWINDHVIIPKGYPNAKWTIESEGYDTIEVDVSEFKKLDGGLSCLSLRF
jgi:dimethylargininase